MEEVGSAVRRCRCNIVWAANARILIFLSIYFFFLYSRAAVVREKKIVSIFFFVVLTQRAEKSASSTKSTDIAEHVNWGIRREGKLWWGKVNVSQPPRGNAKFFQCRYAREVWPAVCTLASYSPFHTYKRIRAPARRQHANNNSGLRWISRHAAAPSKPSFLFTTKTAAFRFFSLYFCRLSSLAFFHLSPPHTVRQNNGASWAIFPSDSVAKISPHSLCWLADWLAGWCWCEMLINLCSRQTVTYFEGSERSIGIWRPSLRRLFNSRFADCTLYEWAKFASFEIMQRFLIAEILCSQVIFNGNVDIAISGY